MGYSKLGSIFLSLLLLGSSAAAEQIEENVTEYEYDLSEIECGQGQTAQVERFFYPDENRAEVNVDSELLRYTAKIQSRESDEFADTYILTMDVEIAQKGKPVKSQQIGWKYSDDPYDYSTFNGTEAVDFICPNFQDANRDGYLDFLVLNYSTSREGWHTIFVWDEESEEYVQVKLAGSEYAELISSYPEFYDGYVEQWSTVGFYEQRFERFRWEGNELVLENKIRMSTDAENGTVVYDMEDNEYIPEGYEELRQLLDDLKAYKGQ